MSIIRVTTILSLTLAFCTAAAAGSTPAPAEKPLLTDQPYLCVGAGFVAMVPSSGSRPPLIILRISASGIEEPETLQLNGGEEFDGLRCTESVAVLLVRDTKSSQLCEVPFYIEKDGIERGPQEATPQPTVREVWTPRRLLRIKKDTFQGAPRAGDGMRGNWYVEVPAPIAPMYRQYELHFVETKKHDRGLVTSLVVSLLEETFGWKVTRSVPLIHYETFEPAD